MADEPLVVDGLHRHPVVVAGIEAVQGDLRLVGFEDVGGVVQVAHFQLVMHQVARRTCLRLKCLLYLFKISNYI